LEKERGMMIMGQKNRILILEGREGKRTKKARRCRNEKD
jgi:hypothetical protein